MEVIAIKMSDCKQLGTQPLHKTQYQNAIYCIFWLMMIHRHDAICEVYVFPTEEIYNWN